MAKLGVVGRRSAGLLPELELVGLDESFLQVVDRQATRTKRGRNNPNGFMAGLLFSGRSIQGFVSKSYDILMNKSKERTVDHF
jgi:hypothetical protein